MAPIDVGHFIDLDRYPIEHSGAPDYDRPVADIPARSMAACHLTILNRRDSAPAHSSTGCSE